MSSAACLTRQHPESIVPHPYARQTVLAEPVRFAPGIVSTEAIEYNTTFTPDGKTLYFTRRPGVWGQASPENATIYVTHYEGGHWSTPQVAPFSGVYSDSDAFVTLDGERLFFVSNRPLHDEVKEDRDIWVMERTAAGWGEPQHLSAVNSGSMEYSPVVAASGDLYFASTRPGTLGQGDLFVARYVDGQYTPPAPLGAPVNSETGEWNLMVAPDERYIIFEASGRAENKSPYGDLYISYRQEDGPWSQPINLEALNTTGSNLMPRLSPDGRYLFFASTETLESPEPDIFQVELQVVLDRYRPQLDDEAVFLVANRAGHDVALIDPVTYEILARLPTGRGPHEVITSPDGHYAYVANFGVYPRPHEDEITDAELEWVVEESHTITVLDVQARTVRATYDLGDCLKPHGIATDQHGTHLWVTCEGSQKVVELDAATGQVLKTWRPEQRGSHMVLPAPDGRMLYVANTASGTVSVIDRASDTINTLSTGGGAEGMAFSPDGRVLWVLNNQEDTISILDVASTQVIETFASAGAFPIDLAFAAGGSEVWVTNNDSDSITIYDALTQAVVETIDLGTTPLSLVLSPDGQRAFVTVPRKNSVMVYDVATRQLVQVFLSGIEPDGMAWGLTAH